ncbi:MAG: hypothetical protein IJO87_08610 [Eggerthellaceae bacterium]|nr:hypothetical protein [Eggerthellaceae bacterium]
MSKKFSEIRKRAKSTPLFVSDRNEIDTVILDYQAYEDMYMELEYLREQRFYEAVAERIAKGDADPARKSIGLDEAMGAEALAEYLSIDPDAISDEELFE